MERVHSVINRGIKTRIELENGSVYALKKNVLSEFPVAEDSEIDEEQFLQFVRLHQYPEALNTAVSMLARRACSRKEIEDRLRRNDFCDDVIELVMYKLEKENLLNDQDFSSQWTRYRSSGHYGPNRIYRELRMKGVDEETAREAVDEIDDGDRLRMAVDLALKGFRKARPGEDPRKVQQRVLRTLVQRGFDWDTARSACSHALSEE